MTMVLRHDITASVRLPAVAWPRCLSIDVESLLSALGAELTEARGSRVVVVLNGVKAVFHEPHPQKEIGKCMVRSMRDFLNAAGIRPPG